MVKDGLSFVIWKREKLSSFILAVMGNFGKWIIKLEERRNDLLHQNYYFVRE